MQAFQMAPKGTLLGHPRTETNALSERLLLTFRV